MHEEQEFLKTPILNRNSFLELSFIEFTATSEVSVLMPHLTHIKAMPHSANIKANF